MPTILLYNKRGLLKGDLKRQKFPSKIEITDPVSQEKITYIFWKFIGINYEKAGYKEVA